MLVYDEQLPALDDKFEGDEVALLAVRGGKVDRNFRRSYAWAKHAADAGKLKKVSVVVEITKADWIHTVGAVTSALSGQRLHSAAVFSVRLERPGYSGTAEKVGEALNELAAPAKQGGVVGVVKEAAGAPKPQGPSRDGGKPQSQIQKKDGDE